MKRLNIILILSIVFFIFSCQFKGEERHFWVKVSIIKELGFTDLTLNGQETTKELEDEYAREFDIRSWERNSFLTNDVRDVLLLKFPKGTKLSSLTNEMLEIKSQGKQIWSAPIYDEKRVSPCGFYSMKDQKNVDESIITYFSFHEKKLEKSLLLSKVYYDTLNGNNELEDLCENQKTPDSVMLSVALANQTFNEDPIVSMNGENFRPLAEEPIWNAFRDVLESSGLSSLYHYLERQDGYLQASRFWSQSVKREALKDYEFKLLSKTGKSTVLSLKDIQLCGGEEKSFLELIPQIGVLTYAFTTKDGKARLDFKGGITADRHSLNCSKTSGETSGIMDDPSHLKQDRYGDIDISFGDNQHTVFSDNYLNISYGGIGDMYKKTGESRWFLSVRVDYSMNTEKGFSIVIPWKHLTLGQKTLSSDEISSSPSDEQELLKSALRPLFYSSEHPIDFLPNGVPHIDYGNQQSISYDIEHLPAFYGDYLTMRFHFIAKQDENILLDYQGRIHSRYYGEDIFHCFNDKHQWICPSFGYEANHPWMED